MKKMVLFSILTVVVLFVIEHCTVVDLSPKLLIKKSAYKKFPELNDGLEWGKLRLDRITEVGGVNLRYFPHKNFFLVSNYKRLGHFIPMKLDSLGNIVFQLDLDKSSPAGFFDANNCFVIEEDRIYDFSEDELIAVPFHNIINKNNSFTSEKWIKTFEENYQSADIVIYGWITELLTAQCVYFQKAGKWTKLYAFEQSGPNFIYPDGAKIKCKIKGREIPEKLHEAHFLKDVTKYTYSTEHRYTDRYITPYNYSDFSFFPDQSLKYKRIGNINLLAFSKEKYIAEGYLNPGIPSAFYGTGFYDLNIDGDILNFKTKAIKHNGLGENTETDLFLFSLPTQFAERSSVYFLTYDYDTNFNDNNKRGVYVIRKNENKKE